METLSQGILITLFGGVVLAGLIYCLKVRFHIRPVITLKYISGIEQTSAAETGQLRCEWRGTIELHNPTPHDAYDVVFLPQSRPLLPTPRLEPATIPSKQTAKVPFNIEKVFDKAVIFPHANDPPRADFTPPVVRPLRDFFPAELKEFHLVVQYTNGHGLKFYTRLDKTTDAQTWSTQRIKPRT